MAYRLRPMQESDGPAVTHLMENDPPSKGMASTTCFQVDSWQAWTALKRDMVGVVAEDIHTGEIVGTATVSFERVMFEGEYLPSAFLENLKCIMIIAVRVSARSLPSGALNRQERVLAKTVSF